MADEKLYGELAHWWPLLSPPDDYAGNAQHAFDLLAARARRPVETVLELGSGGGHNAFHMKRRARMTLVDLSASMVAVSKALNPECRHVVADMRTVRLGEAFDAVFVHDAIMYMLDRDDLAAAVRTAGQHCRPDGAALFAPDFTLETFTPGTSHGGHDGGGRGLRYLEWIHPREGRTFVTSFAYLLRTAGGHVTVEHDRHVNGLFSRSEWLEALQDAGFEAEVAPDPLGRVLFVGVRRSGP